MKIRSFPSRRSCCRSLFAFIFILLVGGFAAPSAAQSCSDDLTCGILDCRSPASGVPSTLWGDLQPVDTGQLPADRDNTDWTEFISGSHTYTQPHWLAFDIEQGADGHPWMYAAITYGLELWDLANPTAPVRVARFGRDSFINWPTDPHEFSPVRWVDAPTGDPTVVAVGLAGGAGLAVFASTPPSAPKAKYADGNKTILQVYADRIGATEYSFSATNGEGIAIHNLTVAKNLTSSCSEDTAVSSRCGVYVGSLGNRTSYSYVSGVSNSTSTSEWIAASGGGRTGVEIWNASNPKTPFHVLDLVSSSYAHGLALWRQGTRYYLGVRISVDGTTTQAQIYDVSCISSNSCSSAPKPIWTKNLPNDGGELYTVTHSESGGRQFLYYGHGNRCNEGLQSEWLFDVTAPSGAFDITPPAGLVNGKKTGYWGWYYRRNPTGFNLVAPQMGLFHGVYFYRAGYSIFDIHTLSGPQPPVADFTYQPATAYQGDPVSFTDLSSGDPTSWSWTFQGATPSSSSSQNPSGVVFNTAGTKQVSLTATNNQGSDTASQSIQVLDPSPLIGSVSASPADALVCQTVTLSANSVTGRPPLSYAWTVKDVDGSPAPGFTSVNAPSVTWAIPTDTTPGTFTAQVTVTGDGSASKSTTINVSPLPALAFTADATPTLLSVSSGSAQLTIDDEDQGAAQWTWDFGANGNGQCGAGFTTLTDGRCRSVDPAIGPKGAYTYKNVGTYQVTVEIQNCVEGPITSSPAAVAITQIEPLHAEFKATAGASCSDVVFLGRVCTGNVNQAITFDHSATTGSPETYAYDWDHPTYDVGSCSFGAPYNSPVTTHTYTTSGTHHPCLKVTRNGGSEQDVFVHGEITIGTPTPATISVTGPSTGNTGAALTFYGAGGGSCNASPSGWNWTASGGGTLSGNIHSSQVTVTWTSAGTKTVSASNTGCVGVSNGTHSVSITEPGGGTPPGGGGSGTLSAKFNFSPSAPETGQTVNFDGSASGGSPTSYTWDFGDGKTGNGAKVSHSYGAAGTYQVTLEVGKPDSSCAFGYCIDDVTKGVSVSGPAGLSASFTADVTCGGFGCLADTGQEVQLTDTSQGDITSRSWDFGDGTTGTGKVITHVWSSPGSFAVKLKVKTADDSATATQTFIISGDPVAGSHVVVLPWIAQADPGKALQQESDLYVHNPGPGSLTVEMTFRRQGLPEPDPPHVTETLKEHQTLYLADVMTDLFDRPNLKGFLVIEPTDGDAQPIVTSFNRTHDDGRVYGQVIPGVELSDGTSARASGTDIQHLVGLNDTENRLGYFGITNPTDSRLSYDLEFFDSIGRPIGGTAEPVLLPPFGFKQYQVEEIRKQFGVEAVEDYRLIVQPTDGSGAPIPFGANLRLGSKDPSFVRAGRTDSSEMFIVGALDSAGLNNSVFQSDLVLANTTDREVNSEVTFTGVGPFTEPSAPIEVSLPPRDTTRLTDVISNWDTESTLGVLRIQSDSPTGVYPVVQGESYEVSDPYRVYGQFMPGLTIDDAASPGTPRSLVGLRQDADFITGTRSTVWLYNPEDTTVTYTLHYFDLNGKELGTEDASLGGGKLRQINPGFHPLPAGGAPDGFVLRVEVSKGKVLVTGQVVNQFNDPAYIVGR